jgi:hypothetical protein
MHEAAEDRARRGTECDSMVNAPHPVAQRTWPKDVASVQVEQDWLEQMLKSRDDIDELYIIVDSEQTANKPISQENDQETGEQGDNVTEALKLFEERRRDR